MKNKILLFILLVFPVICHAQKISLGSCSVEEMGIKGVYKGQMLAGKPHGRGSVLFDNGNTYEGDFVKGKRQGRGIYTFADGEKYEGEWLVDQQHGQGTYSATNNNREVG